MMNKRIRGLNVNVSENDRNGVEKALRKLKRKLADDNRLREVKEREQYTKPSETRKRAKAAAVKRHKKSLESSQLKRQPK